MLIGRAIRGYNSSFEPTVGGRDRNQMTNNSKKKQISLSRVQVAEFGPTERTEQVLHNMLPLNHFSHNAQERIYSSKTSATPTMQTNIWPPGGHNNSTLIWLLFLGKCILN
jgi:hypothetical protein